MDDKNKMVCMECGDSFEPEYSGDTEDDYACLDCGEGPFCPDCLYDHDCTAMDEEPLED